MSDDNIAIKVGNLSKCYQIYNQPHDRLKQSINPRMQRLFGKLPKKYFREFWALKDVSFDVGKGETVGIIGRNGSGKSTLLQIICGTLGPTMGEVETYGRVAALLELGAGFNPDFTGRENVYMNATVLGLNQTEIDDRFSDIAAFADIGEFIEQPVKLYSSGMYARLAFAVAISVNPNILIVDEALAVGDEAFQRKCFARMEQIKADGATILLVAHSGALITQLCDRAILLNEGMNLYTGEPKQAVAWYQKLAAAPHDLTYKVIQEMVSEQEDKSSAVFDAKNKDEVSLPGGSALDIGSHTKGLSANGDAEGRFQLEARWDEHLKSKSTVIFEKNGGEISDVRIETLTGIKVNCLVSRERYQVSYRVKFERDAKIIKFHFRIRTVSGVTVGGAMAPNRKENLSKVDINSELDVLYEFDCNLVPGVYFLNCGVTSDGEVLHRCIDILMFRVLENDSNYSDGFMDLSIKAVCLKIEK